MGNLFLLAITRIPAKDNGILCSALHDYWGLHDFLEACNRGRGAGGRIWGVLGDGCDVGAGVGGRRGSLGSDQALSCGELFRHHVTLTLIGGGGVPSLVQSVSRQRALDVPSLLARVVYVAHRD